MISMTVKKWNKLYQWLLIVSALYTFWSILPPTVGFGIVIGIICISINLSFYMYTRKLIKEGRGEEIRP